MPRPYKCRCVSAKPKAEGFKPFGLVAPSEGSPVEIPLDELEALCLADFKGMHQEEAGACMGVSRATFGRLLGGARRKVANALANARPLVFKGGAVRLVSTASFACADCGRRFELPVGASPPDQCPLCHGTCIVPCREESGSRRSAG